LVKKARFFFPVQTYQGDDPGGKISARESSLRSDSSGPSSPLSDGGGNLYHYLKKKEEIFLFEGGVYTGGFSGAKKRGRNTFLLRASSSPHGQGGITRGRGGGGVYFSRGGDFRKV